MRSQKARRLLAPILAAVLLFGAGVAGGAENIDPANDGHQYAWGENAGWFNLEPSGTGGPGAEVSDTSLKGWMWSENNGWVSLSCVNTSSCGTSSYGVGNDWYGVLSGFAWGENAGWINFSPTTCKPDPTCGVTIDPWTGYFRGRAWGENIGWITFSSTGPIESTARTNWCQEIPGTPGSGFVVSVSKAAPDVNLSWTALLGARRYDIVRGSLSTLRSSGGDFTVSTEQCVADKLAGASYPSSEPTPSPGNGFWFLVRGENCKGRGTFESGEPSQVGTRDAEIAASGHGCS